MRRFRWDLMLAAVVLAVAIVAHGLLGRYQLGTAAGDMEVVLDRLTGETCQMVPNAQSPALACVSRDGRLRAQPISRVP